MTDSVVTIAGPPSMTMRVLAFDPAAGEMGIAVLDYNLLTRTSTVIWVDTLKGASLLKYYKNLRPHFSNSFCIQTAYYHYVLEDLLPAWKPDIVVSEGAYAGRFISAMVSLLHVINSIRRAMCDWCGRDIAVIAPTETKQVITNKGRADKDQMRAGILSHKDIKFAPSITLPEMLTEHEYDAIGHGHAYCARHLVPELPKK